MPKEADTAVKETNVPKEADSAPKEIWVTQPDQPPRISVAHPAQPPRISVAHKTGYSSPWAPGTADPGRQSLAQQTPGIGTRHSRPWTPQPGTADPRHRHRVQQPLGIGVWHSRPWDTGAWHVTPGTPEPKDADTAVKETKQTPDTGTGYSSPWAPASGTASTWVEIALCCSPSSSCSISTSPRGSTISRTGVTNTW